MKPYRVLVVDDSAFMRKIISDLIEQDQEFQVAATAVNGREAVEKVNELKPDLVTMDVEMPEMNGLEALRLIMTHHPLPVIMLSGINEEGMKETIMALESGAFDFIRKPSISNSNDINSVGDSLREQMNEAMLARERREARSASALLTPEAPAAAAPVPSPAPQSPADKPAGKLGTPSSTIPRETPGTLAGSFRKDAKVDIPAPGSKLASTKPDNPAPASRTVKPARPEASKLKPPSPGGIKQAQSTKNELVKPKAAADEHATAGGTPAAGSRDRRIGGRELNKLVAVGCSTGGPRALKAFLEKIPADFPAPILIVQHMPPNFTKSLAQRLNTFSPLEVMEAEQGMVLRKGAAYIAPGGFHMKVAESSAGQLSINLTKEEARNGHRPSVDTLFESLLSLTSLERHAVIMTGMGSDGAKMMKSLYDSGVTSTFAESEETCVVYGMPRSAVELKCVSYILPLQDIAPKLVQVVK
ncbi:chemotaxis response regulator protein-glutamate methylesterase [Paenibacillus sp. HN-1]|uniref:protein-glutamate methylesterase/protein-glutamine glutaminase n=1 Tax=Paenibacillus TaxID=44249 RepID=UPI001CA7F512|nr:MULTISPECIES: chemotaxis response regulator protein-glutamate methylesterase [Paenibacillus]MBY9081904.1 chemotaxis response regulator protein-glutamate methylesterase [Paenibacillus sp. CGMCC 1.18879]MBY9085938.1 chemotaxis response regulator protein-glutamate methylesterase [Paenibacillus sinensis]